MSAMALWTRRDPFTEFDALVRHAFGTSADQPTDFTPAAEITADGDDTVLRVELPGVDVTNDVTIEVTHGNLVVRGERRDESTTDDGRRLREMRYGSFRRSFKLPPQVTADAVSASYDAGVLSIRVAGARSETEPRRITITSGAAAQPAEQPSA